MPRRNTMSTCLSIESTRLLLEIENQLGYVPNLFKNVAHSPESLKSLVILNQQFAKCSLTTTEQEIIQLSTSVTNFCGYCVAGHSCFAESSGVSGEIVRAIREGAPIEDRKLQTLRITTESLVKHRGALTSTQLKNFFDAGYNKKQLVEVILGISIKTLTNTVNKALDTKLDDFFSHQAWIAS